MANNISVIGGTTNVVASVLPAGPPTRPEVRSVPAQASSAEPTGGVPGHFAGTKDTRSAEYAKAQSVRDVSNQQAVSLRDQLDSLAKQKAGLVGIKIGLEAIVKHYPPFLLDSPERAALLNQAIGLKKEIDALQFPSANHAGTAGIAGIAGTHAAVALSGLDSLNVDLITDEELSNILGKVDSNLAKVTQARQKISADVQVFTGNESDASAATRSGESANALAQAQLPITRAKDVLANLL